MSILRSAIFAVAALCAAEAFAQRGPIFLDPPPEGVFVADHAGLLDADAKQRIDAVAAALLRDNATPILVVTIRAMSDHSDGSATIEGFAARLFDQWGIGHAEIDGKAWNTGMLFLVSEGDRRARIELGAGWGRSQDREAQRIMDEQIIPRFKEGRFAAGIVAGVEGLDAIARQKSLPMAYRPWWHYAIAAGFVGLLIFTIVSLIRRGSSGWAWLFWGAVFAILGTILYHAAQSKSGSGGFSGGSFGGGFSGGGGASGSW